jgi:ankyrin repeat protein
MELLLYYHADVDAKDLLSRTPLHYAALHNDITALKMLLSSNADPFIHCTLGLEAKEMATSQSIKVLLKKVRKLRIILMWVPFKNQKSCLLTALREINDTGYATSLYNTQLSS